MKHEKGLTPNQKLILNVPVIDALYVYEDECFLVRECLRLANHGATFGLSKVVVGPRKGSYDLWRQADDTDVSYPIIVKDDRAIHGLTCEILFIKGRLAKGHQLIKAWKADKMIAPFFEEYYG